MSTFYCRIKSKDMPKVYFEYLEELEKELHSIANKNNDIFEVSELSIKAIINSLELVRERVKNESFKTEEEEIYFFKKIKPKFISKLIYHSSVFNIERYKPFRGIEAKKDYYEDELEKLEAYVDKNRNFFQYMRANSDFLDNRYFLRGKFDIHLKLESYYFEADPAFSTSHDFKAARFISTGLLRNYIEDQLNKLDEEKMLSTTEEPKLKWSDSKASMVELIYALHAKGVFNDGNASLKEVAEYFQQSFDIDLGNYHRSYLEIRQRKIERTKFLDSLILSLNNRMDESDEK